MKKKKIAIILLSILLPLFILTGFGAWIVIRQINLTPSYDPNSTSILFQAFDGQYIEFDHKMTDSSTTSAKSYLKLDEDKYKDLIDIDDVSFKYRVHKNGTNTAKYVAYEGKYDGLNNIALQANTYDLLIHYENKSSDKAKDYVDTVVLFEIKAKTLTIDSFELDYTGESWTNLKKTLESKIEIKYNGEPYLTSSGALPEYSLKGIDNDHHYYGAKKYDNSEQMKDTDIVVGSTYFGVYSWESLPVSKAFENKSYILNDGAIEYASVAILKSTNATSISAAKLYTIEKAISTAGSTEAIVIANDTCFAGYEVAKAVGYIGSATRDVNIEDVQSHTYKVQSQILVPFGASVEGLTTTGQTNGTAVKLYKIDNGVNTSLSTSGVNLFSTDIATTNRANPKNSYKTNRITGGFATFIIPNKINLSVAKTLTVNAVMNIADGASMYVNGVNYGEMVVESGAKVILESGSTFNCFGFSRGAGEIVVNENSSVYEPLNASGFKGHNASMGASEKSFPINQYTLTSIACKMILDYKSKYYGKVTVTVNDTFAYCATANLLGIDSKSFIELSSNATFTKSINKGNGRITFTLDGLTTIHNLDIATMDLSSMTFGMIKGKIDLRTTGREIPLAGHFKIQIASGVTTIPSDVKIKLLPGAEIQVDSGAEIDLFGGIYSYGVDNVFYQQGYSHFKDGQKAYPIASTSTCYGQALDKTGLGYDASTPAIVCVDGKMTIKSGAILCAQISSSGGGKLDIQTDKLNGKINEDDADSVASNPYEVSFNARSIHGDESTSPLAKGEWMYANDGEDGRWIGNFFEIIYHVNCNDENNPAYLTGNKSDLYPVEEITEDTIITSSPTRKYHVFVGWYYDEECTQKVGVAEHEPISKGYVLDVYAKWEAIEYSIEFDMEKLSNFTGDIIPPLVDTWHYGIETSLGEPDYSFNPNIEFSGWKMYSDHSGATITEITNDIIKYLTIVGNDQNGYRIIVYGSFRLDNEFEVIFIVNAPHYATESETYHQLNSYYSFDEIQSTTGEAGYPLPSGLLNKVTSPLKAIDSTVDSQGGNIVEYYFVGWQVKIADENLEGGYRYIFIEEDTVIEPSYLNEDGNLILQGVWNQKSRLKIELYSNSQYGVKVTLDLTIDNVKLKQFVGTSKNGVEWYYYYPENTKIEFQCYGEDSTRSILGKTYGGPSVWYSNFGKAKDLVYTKDTKTDKNGSFLMPGPDFVGNTQYAVNIQMNTSGCLVEGTKVLLSDGSLKNVEDLLPGDNVVVFNHLTGEYETGTMWITLHNDLDAMSHRILNLHFSNESVLRIVDSHGLFDCTLQKYVFISDLNAYEYIGHEFSSVEIINGKCLTKKVTLTSIYMTEEFVRIYSPISVMNMNVVTEGILTTSPITRLDDGIYNAFSYDENMKYDEVKMLSDIELYGLYTYDDFKDLIPYEIFEAAPWKYLKVAVGKNYITWDDILWNVKYLFKNGFVEQT